MTIKGTRQNDVLGGTGRADTFVLGQGGNDTVSGLGGDDRFWFRGAFGAHDKVDGGNGNDLITLHGDYSAGLTLGVHTLTSVESIRFGNGFDYSLTTNNHNVAAGQTLGINAARLSVHHTLTFDGSAETDGSFAVRGGAGNDVVTGGAQADTFFLSAGGDDTVHGGDGGDRFKLGHSLTAADKIDGGAGNDIAILNGDYTGRHAVTFNATTMLAIDTIKFASGHSYDITTHDATVATGQTLTVDASALGAGDTLTFDGRAETDGGFHITGGAGDDIAAFGGPDVLAASSFDGGGGNDTLELNGDFSVAPLELDGSTIVHVEKLVLDGGHSYDLLFDDAFVGAGETFTVDASTLGSSDTLAISTSESDGGFNITGGAGDDTFSASGNEVFANSVFDGSAGNDTLDITGLTAALTLNGAHYQNVDVLKLEEGNNYSLTLTDNFVASGDTLTVDASLLHTHSLTLDIGAESNGAFDITGGNLGDTVTFGNAAVTADSTFNGGAGSDTVIFDNGFAFTPTSLAGFSSIESVQFADGGSYDFTTADNFVSSGATATIDGSALTGLNTLFFDGSAETDGAFAFTGGQAGDTLKGGALADTFDLTLGGDDTAAGGGGNDVFVLGGAFTAADAIDGGAGTNDKVVLDGDYSDTAGHQVSFGAATMTNVEDLVLTSGNSYYLVLDDATVASGATLTVDASGTAAGDEVTVIASAETNGSLAFIGGAGSSTFAGGAGADTFDVTASSDIFVTGGAGDDTISVGGNLVAGDQIDGTSGDDTLILDGGYGPSDANTIALGANTIKNIDTIKLGAGHDYYITLNDGNVSSGDTMTVDASALSDTDVININGAAETDGHFHFISGASDFTFTGGALSDSFDLAGSSEGVATGNGGADTFAFAGNYSTSLSVDGGADADALSFNGDYSSMDLNDNNITSVETLKFLGGHTYTGVSVTGDFSGGALTIDASAANSISIDLSGATATTINVTGGTHSDTFIFGADFDPNVSSITGNGGGDVVSLSGDYAGANALTFTAGNFTGVGEIDIAAGHSYSFTTVDANVASGTELFVNGLTLGAGDNLTFNGAAETNGFFHIVAGDGDDVLTGGAGDDTFQLGGGTNSAHGGGGADTFFLSGTDTIGYNAASDSLFAHMDTVGGFDATTDVFDFTAAISAVNSVTVAALSQATLSADLVANCSGLSGTNAYVVTGGTSGDLEGHSYLVVDGNGTAGFQASGDYVIDITGHSGTITAANFI